MTNKQLSGAMQAVDKALASYPLPIKAMAIAAIAGIWAAGNRSAVKRAAGLGASIETMVTALNETVAFNDARRKAAKAKRSRKRRKHSSPVRTGEP